MEGLDGEGVDDLERKEAEEVNDVVRGLEVEVEGEVDKVTEAFRWREETKGRSLVHLQVGNGEIRGTTRRRTFAESEADLTALRVVGILFLGHVLGHVVGSLLGKGRKGRRQRGLCA